LILRYSNLERIKLFNQEKSFAQMKETQKIDWLSFDDKMNVKSTVTLNNNFSGARVMTIISNKQGDIFITSVQQNKLVTDKYAAGKADKTASLSTSFSKYSDGRFDGYRTKLSPDEQSVLFSVCYFTSDKSFNTVTANFNFPQNQVYSSSSDTKAAMGLEKYKGGFIDFDETGFNFYKDKIIR
jgi:hypothetical protein